MKYKEIKNLPKPIVKSIVIICIATSMIGISLGSLAISYQLPIWIPLLLSTCVLAGAAEFTFIGMIASGSSPITAAIAGLLINLRHLPFGLAIHDFIENNKFKYFATHIMNDESVLFGLTQPTRELKRSAYWLCGVGILFAWPIGVLTGYFIGSHLAYAKLLGIDTIFPVVLFALTFKALKRKSTRKSAITGAMISLATVPFLPTGIPILMSLFGLIAGKK
ncbi:AzlC family ABC transporter permease [Acinetobacter nematophilus]|uniref:AzlC family ABC transporter permease n=1 Tax=Acinetobacter nematophilus TaxID=2994642 RepID=A0A9X3DTE0_9GAMM|nr:AzlC family ABC transporter permease [Acinetobacter nematophilus]MCX5467072.1 AzlC family ABC transporter permease [Acinetobacter nematophilus]